MDDQWPWAGLHEIITNGWGDKVVSSRCGDVYFADFLRPAVYMCILLWLH